MAIDAPTWARPEDVAEHGATFLAVAFNSRAHFEHAKATGFTDLRQPANARRAAKRAADPIAAAREALRQRVNYSQRAITDAKRKVAEAQTELAQRHCFDEHRLREIVKTQEARIVERVEALKRAEVDLQLFDYLHPR